MSPLFEYKYTLYIHTFYQQSPCQWILIFIDKNNITCSNFIVLLLVWTTQLIWIVNRMAVQREYCAGWSIHAVQQAQQLHQTQQPAQVPNFPISDLLSLRLLLSLQLSWMTCPSCLLLAMSDQSPLMLTVPAENDFIDNYDLDGNDNDIHCRKICSLPWWIHLPWTLTSLQSCFDLSRCSKTSKLASMNKTVKETACLSA